MSRDDAGRVQAIVPARVHTQYARIQEKKAYAGQQGAYPHRTLEFHTYHGIHLANDTMKLSSTFTINYSANRDDLRTMYERVGRRGWLQGGGS